MFNSNNKPNVRGGFSDRNKIKPLIDYMQLHDFDEHTRNSILIFIHKIMNYLGSFYDYYGRIELASKICEILFNKYIGLEERIELNDVCENIDNICLTGDYDEILTILERLCQFAESYKQEDHYKWMGIVKTLIGSREVKYITWYEAANSLLEKEFVGYRFLNNEIKKITNDEEIESIENASNTPYDNVNNHIRSAISNLKGIDNQDYKKSIHESEMALECMLNIINKNSKKTLKEALDEYCKNSKLHSAFKKSIVNFYGYSSDSSGIRHDTNGEDFNEGFNEAKLILVYTSALINYLLSMSNE